MQTGGAYNSQYYTGELYRLSHLFHHLARKTNYDANGGIRDINFYHIESGNGKHFFPIGNEYEILWNKLQDVREVQQKISIHQNKKKLNHRTLFSGPVMKDIPNPEMFFKALGDHLWGFLKNKEGDLEKNLISSFLKTPIGHTIGTGIHARKIAELVTTMLLLNHGVKLKQIYQNRNSAGKINDLSLSQKIMLLHIFEKATWGNKAPENTKQAFITKYLEKTPVDLLMNSLFRQKYYRNLLNRKKELPMVIDDLELIRELGNLAAHAGRPGKGHNWQNRLDDDQQDDLAGALLNMLHYMLTSMKIGYKVSRKSKKIK